MNPIALGRTNAIKKLMEKTFTSKFQDHIMKGEYDFLDEYKDEDYYDDVIQELGKQFLKKPLSYLITLNFDDKKLWTRQTPNAIDTVHKIMNKVCKLTFIRNTQYRYCIEARKLSASGNPEGYHVHLFVLYVFPKSSTKEKLWAGLHKYMGNDKCIDIRAKITPEAHENALNYVSGKKTDPDPVCEEATRILRRNMILNDFYGNINGGNAEDQEANGDESESPVQEIPEQEESGSDSEETD